MGSGFVEIGAMLPEGWAFPAEDANAPASATSASVNIVAVSPACQFLFDFMGHPQESVLLLWRLLSLVLAKEFASAAEVTRRS